MVDRAALNVWERHEITSAIVSDPDPGRVAGVVRLDDLCGADPV